MNKALCAFVLLIVSSPGAAQWAESPDIAELFRHAKVDGTFVVLNMRTGALTGYNEKRARTRFVPASTFKIVNTLIGLSVGAVSSVDEVVEYGGRPQMVKAWERDMSLREAIAMSNVPIYQTLARRIGLEQMTRYLQRLDYGNMATGSAVDRFWLDGPLQISAVEQTAFLARLADKRLPLAEGVQSATQDIVLNAAGEGWGLWAKSGWQNAPDPGVGWWVGWVSSAGINYPFALNIDVETAQMAATREPLGKACLQSLGLLH